MTRVRPVVATRGPHVEVSHVVWTSPEAAWSALVDTRRWPEWSPYVTDVEASDRRVRTGTTGRIRTRWGVWLPFTVVERSERDRRWRWTVARLPTAAHRVDDLGNGRCRIAFELSPFAVGHVGTCLRALERLESDLASTEGASANGAR